jgi:hypothetical protein
MPRTTYTLSVGGGVLSTGGAGDDTAGATLSGKAAECAASRGASRVPSPHPDRPERHTATNATLTIIAGARGARRIMHS